MNSRLKRKLASHTAKKEGNNYCKLSRRDSKRIEEAKPEANISDKSFDIALLAYEPSPLKSKTDFNLKSLVCH
jgi:hypothetical protein